LGGLFRFNTRVINRGGTRRPFIQTTKKSKAMESNFLEVLNLFTDNSEAALREKLKTPFYCRGVAAATDAYICAYTPRRNVAGLETVWDDLKYEFFDWPDDAPEVILKVEDLKAILSKIPKERLIEEIKTECDECYGSGSVIWHYNHNEQECDCPECGGAGYTNIREIDRGETFADDYDLQFGAVKVAPARFEYLIKAAEVLNTPVIRFYRTDKKEVAHFKIGRFYFDIAALVGTTEHLIKVC